MQAVETQIEWSRDLTEKWSWEGKVGRYNNTTIRIHLRCSNLEDGVIGWSIQLGEANPVRDASLAEIMTLTAAGVVAFNRELIQAHIDAIEIGSEASISQGLMASKMLSRSAADNAVRLVRDVIRMRKEVYDALGKMSQEDEYKVSQGMKRRPPMEVEL
jgi:hypothetical protein